MARLVDIEVELPHQRPPKPLDDAEMRWAVPFSPLETTRGAGSSKGEPMLCAASPGLEQVIGQWADELAAIGSGTAALDYRSWKDVYDHEGAK